MKNGWSHPAAISAEALLADCQVRYTKGTGPGGQHRNKVETAVIVTHVPTGLIGQASERRSREENRCRAVRRLRLRLATKYRTSGASLEDLPSPLWLSRCRKGRIEVNPQHDDFPALLAEALDLVTFTDFDLRLAAVRLGCSASQLIKLIQAGPPEALIDLNQQRQAKGMRPLR